MNEFSKEYIRHIALDHAIDIFYRSTYLEDPTDKIISIAKKFENYIAGDSGENNNYPQDTTL